MNGATTINVNSNVNGTYVLVTGSTITGGTNATVVNAADLTGKREARKDTGTAIVYKIFDASSVGLTWTGVADNNWDFTKINWVDDDGDDVAFANNDSVTFGGTAPITARDVVVVAGGVTVGDMAVNESYNFSGGTITATGEVTVAAGKTLGLDIGTNAPMIIAYSANLSDSTLNITGYTPDESSPHDAPRNVQTVIQSSSNILGFNPAVTVADQPTADFLSAKAYLSADSKSVTVETGLTWYSTDTTRKAHGDFTISPASSVFTLGAVLANTTTNLDPTWNGTTLTKLGDGTLILTAANTYNGGTTISAGTLQIGDGGLTGSIVGNVLNNATLAFNRSNDDTFGGAITGTGAVTKAGAGIITLTTANSYSGGTTISAGAIVAGNQNALGTGTVNVNANSGLQFAAGTNAVTIGGLAGSGNIALVDNHTTPAAVALTVGGNDANTTYSGAMSGTGSVTKTGAGTLTLTGANSYAGGTTISAGILEVGSGGTTGSIAGNVTNNAAIKFNRSDAVTFGGAISGSGTLTKDGTGTLTLSGANTYAGSTTISAGTLTVTGSLGTGGVYAGAISNAGTLNLNQSAAQTLSGVISGAGSIEKDGAGLLTLTNDSSGFSGAFTQTTGNVTLTGAKIGGTYTQAIGTTLNTSGAATLGNATFAGTVNPTGTLTTTSATFNAATLNIGTALGTNKIVATGNADIAGGVTITLNASGMATGDYAMIQGATLTGTATDSTVIATLGANQRGGDFVDTPSTTLYYHLINGNTTLVWGGVGTSDDWNTTAANTNWNDGTIDTHFLTNDNVVFDSTAVAKKVVITGGDVRVGTMEVKDSYSFSGDRIVATGAVTVDAGNMLSINVTNVPVITADSMDFNNSTLDIDGYTPTNPSVYPPPVVPVVVIHTTGSATDGVSNFNPLVTIAGGHPSVDFLKVVAYLSPDRNDVLVETGLSWYSTDPTPLHQAHGTFTIEPASSTFTLGAILANNTINLAPGWDGTKLEKLGDGTLVLTEANIYTGGTTITAGTLQIGNGGTGGSIVGDVLNNATLAFNRSNAYTFGDVITGTGVVTKSGAGTLTLSGANNYSGGTTVSAGTLSVASDINVGTGAVTLTNNSTLAVTGIGVAFNRDIAVGAGGGIFNNANAVSSSGVISGATTLTKTGAGTLTLTGDSSGFLGTFAQSVGTVTLTGAKVGGTYTQAIGTILNTSGTAELGAATFRGTINPTGTLTTTSATFNAATLNIGTGLGTNNIVATGNANISSGVTVNLDARTTLTAGAHDYALIQGATLTGTAANATVNATLAANQRGGDYVNATADTLFYHLITGNATFVWGGVGASDNWNTTAANTNWKDSAITTYFVTGDNVIFDSTAAAKNVVVAAGGVQVGTMSVEDHYTFSGGKITATGAVTVNAGASLGLNIATNAPALVANSVDFNTTGALNITGYTPGESSPYSAPRNVQTVIHTTGGVSNFNPAVTVSGQASVDFLSASASVVGTDVVVETGLTWYSTDTVRKAHGDFTINGAGNSFTLGAVLADNSASTNRRAGWSGNTLTKLGDGTLILTAANSYNGGTTISAGTLQIGDGIGGGTTGSIVGNVINNATLAFNRSNAYTFGGDISGTGDLVKLGAGTLTLSGANTYTGDTTIVAGTLNVSGSLIVGSTSTLTSGIYETAGGVWTSNIITSPGGIITFVSGSTWYVKEDEWFSGGLVAGQIFVNDPVAAQAALTKGNERNELYNFIYDSSINQLNANAKTKGKVSDTMVNTPLMFSPGAMGMAAAGRVAQRFGSTYYKDRILCTGKSRSDCDTGCDDDISCDDGTIYRSQNNSPCAPARIDPCSPVGNLLSPVGNLCSWIISTLPPVSQPAYWANYSTSGTQLVSSLSGRGFSGNALMVSNGVQVGADAFVGNRKRTMVGAMFNYEHARDTLNASNMFGDNYAVSIYAAHQFGCGFDGFALAGYGHQQYNSLRHNPTGNKFSTADFAGNTFEMTLEVGRRFRLYKHLWLRPAVAVDFYNNDIANFTEDGFDSQNGFIFGKMSHTQTFIRIGNDVILKRGRAAATVGLYYSYQMSEHGDQIFSTADGGDGLGPVSISGSYLGRNKVTFNLGGSYVIDDFIDKILDKYNKSRKRGCTTVELEPVQRIGSASVYGGYSNDFYADRAGKPWGHSGNVGLRWAF